MTKVLFMNWLRKKTPLFIVVLAMLAVGAVLSEHFLTVNNMINIINQSAIVGILAIGATFVIIAGGLDLSVGGVVALTGVIVGLVNAYNPYLAVILALAAGILTGLVNSALIVKAKIPFLIVTLAVWFIAEGIGYLLTDAKPIFITNNPIVQFIGSARIWIFPIPAVIFIVVSIIAYFLLSRSVFGFYIYAIGNNEEAVKLSGAKVEFYRSMAYVINGFCAALASIILVSRVSTADPTVGKTLALDAITPAIIGGTDIMGGAGTIGGTFIGVIILALLGNLFNLLNINAYWQFVVKGVILIAAIYLANRNLSKSG